MVRNAQGLLAGKAVSMALGFAFWLVVARSTVVAEVGIASAAIGASFLVVQIALLGVDSGTIQSYPQYAARPRRLILTACAIVAAAALACALVLLGGATWSPGEMRAAAADPVFAFVFLVTCVSSTVGALLDRVSAAPGRGHQTALRNLVNGGVSTGTLATLAVLLPTVGARDIVACFTVGTMTAVAIALAQAVAAGQHQAAATPRAGLMALLRSSLSYYPLGLVERAPAFVLPLIVTEMISPEANAYWYPVWNLVWAVYLIPNVYSLALFAEGAKDQRAIPERWRHSITSGLVTGGASATGMAIIGYPVLRVFGAGYAEHGMAPLLVLLPAVLPLMVIGTYLAVCRATGHVGEGLLVLSIRATLSLAAAAVAGWYGGLVALAAGWVVVQCVLGGWAFARLLRFEQPLVTAPQTASEPPRATAR